MRLSTNTARSRSRRTIVMTRSTVSYADFRSRTTDVRFVARDTLPITCGVLRSPQELKRSPPLIGDQQKGALFHCTDEGGKKSTAKSRKENLLLRFLLLSAAAFGILKYHSLFYYIFVVKFLVSDCVKRVKKINESSSSTILPCNIH